MRILRGSDGAALVTALMLTMLALVIAMALLHSVTNGTRISAGQKRYRSALAAAHGGVELLTLEILPKLMGPLGSTEDALKSDFPGIGLQLPQFNCLQQKLNNPTESWSDPCKEANASSDPSESPDAAFILRGGGPRGFSVSTKIVDTVPGNSDSNGIIDYLDTGSSVSGKDEAIRPQHVPALYSLSVQGVGDGANAREKARLSVLYAY